MKKRVILILMVLFLVSFVSAADYYVDATNGNDANNGLSDATAWKTIAKVNLFSFSSGDNIKFKRGQTWTDATLTLDKTPAGTTGITVEDYGTGEKPWINGNYVQPIFINHALINLTLKNLEVSGASALGNRIQLQYLNGVTIEGINYDGYKETTIYRLLDCISFYYVNGDIEIKNCKIQNLLKDSFESSLISWGTNDAVGIIFWYPGDDNVKVSGKINVHDNVIHDVYSDCIHLGGIHTTTNIYNNTLYHFGENAIDIKYSRYVNVYENEMYHGDSTYIAGGGGYWGCSIMASGSATQWTGISSSKYNNLYNNYLHTCDYLGVASIGDNAKIYGNYFKNIGGAITIGSQDNVQVYNNIFELTTPVALEITYLGTDYEVDWSTRYVDTALSGIRITSPTKTSTPIYNNTFYLSSTNHLYGIAVQADADATGTIIKNNIIYMNRDSSNVFPLYVQDYDDSGNLPTVEYNNFYGINSNRVSIEETPSNWVVYDSTEQTAWQNAGHTGGLFTNPLFVDAVNGNFHLLENSPACTASEQGSYIGAYPCLSTPTCQSLEYQCCDFCESNPQPLYDADCVEPVCCGVCASISICSPADTDTDGFVSITEVINYITAWKNGTVNINDLINGITEWKNGCA